MQNASPHESCGLLELDGDGYSWLPLGALEFPDYANGGLCGACRVGRYLALATQSTPPLLVLYDPVAARVRARRDMSPAIDLHSVVYHDDTLYVVSTGTNEIYAVALDDDDLGEPRLHWRYPGLEYDRDLVHLNGLTAFPQGLIASCFGPRQPDGSWGSEGAIFQVEPYQVIQGVMSQPHTPLYCDGRLFFAESRGHRVHWLGRDENDIWREQGHIAVGGYARGLALQDHKLWVGLSAPRSISRSKGTRNQGLAPASGPALVCIDLPTGTLTRRRELTGLGEEIYDLVMLDQEPPSGRLADALTQRLVSMRAMLDTVRIDCMKSGEELGRQTQMLEQERVRTEDLAQTLQIEQVYSANLARQLQRLTASRLWRAARFLRRLARRERYEPDLDRPNAPTSHAMADIFGRIYRNNLWGSQVSHSGTGSDLEQTAVIRETLPPLLRSLAVRTLLDVPCGDFHWMRTVDLGVDYIGADVVGTLIAANTARDANEHRRFVVVDIANDDLPCVDLVFCRDLLVHFSFVDALRVIANLKRSGSTYLLTTTFTARSAHEDIATGQWRPINLQLPPFNWPAPLRLINENCTEAGGDWADKSLGLWRLVDI